MEYYLHIMSAQADDLIHNAQSSAHTHLFTFHFRITTACYAERKCKESLRQKEVSRKLVSLSSPCFSSLDCASFCLLTFQLSLSVKSVSLSSVTLGLSLPFRMCSSHVMLKGQQAQSLPSTGGFQLPHDWQAE